MSLLRVLCARPLFCIAVKLIEAEERALGLSPRKPMEDEAS
jgi:hypothetical protein